MKDDEKTRKGPPKRDATCYVLKKNITFPAGTVFRSLGKDDFGAAMGLGDNVTGAFIIKVEPGNIPPSDIFIRATVQ